jgi:UDP-3-O-[3-hydroxymyristoyl] glucosamine N-acyltransferase
MEYPEMGKKYSVEEIVTALAQKYKILGLQNRFISYPSPIDTADRNSITFAKHDDQQALLSIRRTEAGVVVCKPDLELYSDDYKSKTIIQVTNPRLAFIQILQKYFSTAKQFGIDPTAIVSPKAEIHPKVFIGPHAYVGDCQIGEGTMIYGNVHIYSNVVIGKDVTIHTGTTIGVEDAFAYERNENGKLIKFPHFGGVIIEDDVDIHVHVNIDRGTFGNTIIGKGCKINRYAHVGHNSVIGKHCQIGGQVFIAGSSKIGNYSELAFCSCIRNGTKIGKNVMVGMGSVVTQDIEDDWIVYGVPAKKIRKNTIPAWEENKI